MRPWGGLWSRWDSSVRRCGVEGAPSRVKAGLALLAVGAVAASAALGAPAAAATQTGGKLIVVGNDPAIRSDVQHDGLYVMNADGSGLRQVTSSYFDQNPYWSPNGRWIAYEAGSDVDVVAIVREDGSGRRVLGRGSYAGTRSPWSPNGRKVAWGGCGGVCVMDLATSRVRRIRLGADDSDGFAWSKDGKELAAVDGDGRLVLVDVGSGAVARVLAPAGGFPVWSSDGRELAFLSRGRLEVTSAMGGTPRVIARNVARPPEWSPRGRLLLFVAGRVGLHRVEVASAEGENHPRVLAADADGATAWSPDGATIVFTRTRLFLGGSDVWTVGREGGGARQVTNAFPTGVGYDEPDWTSGSLPVRPQAPPPDMVVITPSSERNIEWVDGLSPSGTPDSVAYSNQILCNPVSETTSNSFMVWTPATGGVATNESGCNEDVVDEWAMSPTLFAWLISAELGPEQDTVSVSGVDGQAGEDGSWTTATDDGDIGYENDLGELTGGSMLTFQSTSESVGRQLWRIADGSPPHAVRIPLPPDATDTLDVANGRIALDTSAGGVVVLTADGTVVCRLPPLTTKGLPVDAKLGDDVIGAAVGPATGPTLDVYRVNDASLLTQLPLAHASGPPTLLSVSDDYAAYTSGIELHLLRLRDGADRVLDLPGQAGAVDALITSAGLFVSYNQAYDPDPGRIFFVPSAGLP